MVPFTAQDVGTCDAVVASYVHAPVDVPPDFMGMVIGYWPQSRYGTPSPAPTYGFGLRRIHDTYPGLSGYFDYDTSLFWRALNPEPGVFDWRYLDPLMAGERAAGRKVSYSLFGTPLHAASDTAPDLYGKAGGASVPREIGTRDGHDGVFTALYDFMLALFTRYPWMHYVECWNEPDSYFNGTSADLARLTRTVRLARDMAGAAARVLGPSFTGAYGQVTDFLLAADGAGGLGRHHVDGIAFHFYGRRAPGTLAGEWSSEPITDSIAQLRAAIVAGGLPATTLIYGTEQAPTFLANDDGAAPIFRWGDAEIARYIELELHVQAALGCQTAVLYSHDAYANGATGFCFSPAVRPLIADAIDRVHRNVAGQRLLALDQLADGTWRRTTTAGSVLI